MEELGMVEESVSESTGHKHVIADVLVVDDDPRICRVLAHYLGKEGYEVRTALDGQEMRRRIAEAPPDLVVLDLMLPDEDGLTLARELRAHSDVPIIILTGKTGTADEVTALEGGADDYITKPFDQRSLLAHVHAVLRRKSQQGQVSQGREGAPKESQRHEGEESRDEYIVDWYIGPSVRKSS
jgi:two-component system OmpR family response regulator